MSAGEERRRAGGQAGREARRHEPADLVRPRPQRQVGQEDDLVLEEVRVLGDVVEVQVPPFPRAVTVPRLQEGALEEED